jgi:TetR/AcrR family transcriptional repressor of nem operon
LAIILRPLDDLFAGGV